jgi:hypothetical protein
MNNSYRATLKGNVLEWHTPVPTDTAEALEVTVVVLGPVANEEGKKQQGQRMAQALQALADKNIFKDLDAVTWQKEQRQDRALPTRDE